MSLLPLLLAAHAAASPIETASAQAASAFKTAHALTASQAAQSRYVRLTGTINLNGSAHAQAGAHGVHVTLTGSTRLDGDMGRLRTDTVWISRPEYFTISGNYVSGWARPSAYVSVYQDGRYVGQVRVEGNIHITGQNSNGWVRVSGWGTLEGSLWLNE